RGGQGVRFRRADTFDVHRQTEPLPGAGQDARAWSHETSPGSRLAVTPPRSLVVKCCRSRRCREFETPYYKERTTMLWTIFVILLILWLLGFFVVHVGGGLIHLLLVIAVIVLIVRLITGRPVV